MKQPDEVGGIETQSAYLVVADADKVCARALAAGSTIVIAIKDEDYGGRGFTCLDLEGHSLPATVRSFSSRVGMQSRSNHWQASLRRSIRPARSCALQSRLL